VKIPLAIIGSGPAGYTAGIYASRAKIENILFLGEQPGGQLQITTDVENYPGFEKAVQGPWLMEQMAKQAQASGSQLLAEHISSVKEQEAGFLLQTNKKEYLAQAIIIATGSQAKWLHLESEQKFLGKGVSACATCDGFFFQNKKTIVVGGGNSAVEEALYLSKLCSKVILVHRRDTLRAEKVLQERLQKNPKIEVLWNMRLLEVQGAQSVEAVKLENTKTGATHTQKTDGVFIAIGHLPNTKIFQKLVQLDDDGYIITEPDSTKTSKAGVFACGDVQDKIFRQAVTAAGTGCMAALEAGSYLEKFS
jgi:thioredoxin reductase (NADPH)